LESLGHPVKMFLGSYENLKVTTPEDLALAEALLRARAGGGSPLSKDVVPATDAGPPTRQ